MLKTSLINTNDNRLSDKKQLCELFFSGTKSLDVIEKKRVGVEFEKLPILKNTCKAVPYSTVSKFLEKLHKEQSQWSKQIYENNALLGLKSTTGTITLEPGSQTELSLTPMETISDIEKIIHQYNKSTAQIAEKLGVCWIGYGIQPVSTYKNIHIIPKKRYEYMTKYLPTVAKKPLIMMRETSGIQASFDYSSEEDAMKKFSFALKLSPFISALFANSPIRNGRLTKYKSSRAASWLETDPQRCGLVSSLLFDGNNGENFSFEQYSQILLDIPMIFIERNINGVKTAIRVKNRTFRQFMKDGFQDFQATKNDWLTHISLYFPDVRFKSYIEIRNHDNQRSPLICSIPALWKGLIYNDKAMDEINNMLKGLTYFDFERIRIESPKYGLDTICKNTTLKYFVKEIVNTSYESLKSFNQGEEAYLLPLKSLSNQGVSPADIIIKKWQNEWHNDISKLIEYCKI